MTALSTELALPPALPALRLVPAPASAPPYDDEQAPVPVLRLVAPQPGPPRAPVPCDDDAWLAAERTPTAQLPSARAFAGTLVQGVLEVLAGVRSVKQLQRDTTPELYAVLAETVVRTHLRTPGGIRPDRRSVRSVHVQQRPEGVAEVCATVQRGPRLVALALRLEGLDGRWRCTELVGV
jgi:hypothetical protein